MTASNGRGTAEDARVSPAPTDTVAYLETIADEREQAVKTIESQLKGIERTLASTKKEAVAARKEADKARQAQEDQEA